MQIRGREALSGMNVVCDPSLLWIAIHRGQARSDFAVRVLNLISTVPILPYTKVSGYMRKTSRSKYDTFQCLTAEMLRSLHATSHARCPLNPSTFRAASAIKESACVAIYGVTNMSEEGIKIKGGENTRDETHHKLHLHQILSHL
jgi:hypothetical protein